MLAISCTTSNAIIRYTTDGSDPTEKSSVYSEPIDTSGVTTVKAKAWASGMISSEIATWTAST